jgi:hypothetical protein
MAEKGRAITCREAGAASRAKADHIAHAQWWLYSQPRDAWPFEGDLRPAMEGR